jgi:hypothetical protein
MQQVYGKLCNLKKKEPVFVDHKKQDQLNKKGRVEKSKTEIVRNIL